MNHAWLNSCAVLLAAALFAAGCRTVPPLAPVDTALPGWTLQHGQAVWQPNRFAPEIAGELLLATNPDGATMLEFTKTPLPFVTVQTSNEVWQIEFVPQQRRFSGRGVPTARLMWVHLARALNGVKPSNDFDFQINSQREWQMENRSTGERVSGYLNP